jgi:hypothetical protein
VKFPPVCPRTIETHRLVPGFVVWSAPGVTKRTIKRDLRVGLQRMGWRRVVCLISPELITMIDAERPTACDRETMMHYALRFGLNGLARIRQRREKRAARKGGAP